ncbi:MAG: FG-GAP repeat protein, partial [Phycisphaerales bacterium]|nr:FG-GAP repeat protein [Phycisphaerales bacterium]
MVVGAPASDVYGQDAGLAFVWEWRDTEWLLLDSIIPPVISPLDYFGASVAVSGEWVAVGAPLNDYMGSNAGAVHIFQVSEGAVDWKQTLYDANSNADNQFGYSVAMDGSTLVVGAPYTDNFSGNEGSATVFKLSGSTWIQDAYLPSPESSEDEYTGFSVDVSE